jgi:hypothetical protein
MSVEGQVDDVFECDAEKADLDGDVEGGGRAGVEGASETAWQQQVGGECRGMGGGSGGEQEAEEEWIDVQEEMGKEERAAEERAGVVPKWYFDYLRSVCVCLAVQSRGMEGLSMMLSQPHYLDETPLQVPQTLNPTPKP